MRADRMIATLLLMQARGRVTAAELAHELEVSVATARRDLEALSSAGVPVYPQPGRGGGWSLVGGARTDLTGLTAAESQALFLLVGRGDTSPELASAARKLLRALPGTFREDAQAAADAVRLDETGWGELVPDRPEEADVLQRAVIERRQVEFAYAAPGGPGGARRVSPLGLVVKDAVWYLIATRDGRETRTYRVDRISAIEVLDDAAERPPDFDLAAEWERVVEYVEQRRSSASATVLVRPRHLPALRGHFGRYLQEVGAREDGRVEVTVSAHTTRAVAEQLCGWISVAEVVGPDDVRRELAQIGRDLVAAHG